MWNVRRPMGAQRKQSSSPIAIFYLVLGLILAVLYLATEKWSARCEYF